MRHLKPKQILIVSILFCLGSILVFFFLYKTIRNRELINLNIKEEWRNEATRRENIRSLANMLVSFDQEKNLIESNFVKKSDLVPFLDTLERLAKTSGNEAQISSVDTSKDGSNLLVNLKIEGSFESIYRYILLLENAPYEIEFISANIDNISAQDSKGREYKPWSATLEIKLISFINDK